jgi:hypothetical protein
MTWLEFMLLTPAPMSCTAEVEFLQHGEIAWRCEPVELRLPPLSSRIASDPSLMGAERPSEASSSLRPGHFGLLGCKPTNLLRASLFGSVGQAWRSQPGNKADCRRAEERERPPRTYCCDGIVFTVQALPAVVPLAQWRVLAQAV